MSVAGHQMLRVLDGSYVLDRPADVTGANQRADVLAVVFGPDGTTVMRRADAGEDGWSALWNGDQAHDVQATGMLSAIVAPLAAARVPVWVASSFDGNLVLVPVQKRTQRISPFGIPFCDQERRVKRRRRRSSLHYQRRHQGRVHYIRYSGVFLRST